VSNDAQLMLSVGAIFAMITLSIGGAIWLGRSEMDQCESLCGDKGVARFVAASSENAGGVNRRSIPPTCECRP
jgi:hypothetical protein